jgi:hypothetical protein
MTKVSAHGSAILPEKARLWRDFGILKGHEMTERRTEERPPFSCPVVTNADELRGARSRAGERCRRWLVALESRIARRLDWLQ